MAPAIAGQLAVAVVVVVVVAAVVVERSPCSTAGWKRPKLSLPFGVAMQISGQLLRMPMQLVVAAAVAGGVVVVDDAAAGSGGRELWLPGWPTRQRAIEPRLGFGRSNRLDIKFKKKKEEEGRRKYGSGCQRGHVSVTSALTLGGASTAIDQKLQ